MDREIENIVNEMHNKNSLVNTKKGLIVKSYYKDVLHKYGIDIDEYATYTDIIFMINNFVNNCEDLLDDEYDELDAIANELQEKQYYENTNK